MIRSTFLSSALRTASRHQRRLASTKVTFSRRDGASVPGIEFEALTSSTFQTSPAVIAVQEWWGVDFAIQAQAEKLRAAGYRVIIPDLYRGELGIEAEEAEHLMSNLDFPGAVEDIQGAVDHLRATGSDRVAVMGFCMGGALSVASSVLVDGIDCATTFYGICPDGLADPNKARVPVQGHFGGMDEMVGFSSPSDAAALEAKLQASGMDHEIFIYDGVGHAFMNDTPEGIERKAAVGQGGHDQAVVDKAFERTKSWLGKHLTNLSA